MRSNRLSLTLQPQIFVYAKNDNRIFQVKNRSAADTIFIQFGESPGHLDDAWNLSAGETFTLDPAAPADNIWIWATTAGIANTMLLG